MLDTSLMVFLRQYDRELHRETEPNAVSPGVITKILSSFAVVLLPICVLFLWHNDDGWTKTPPWAGALSSILWRWGYLCSF
jgi:hypothetical protein